MRKLFTFMAAVILTVMVFAQAPEKMSYQAVVRDNANQLITDTQISVKFSILDDVVGTALWIEEQMVTTNANGLLTVELGSITPLSASIFQNELLFIKTEIDLGGGNDYTISGTSQLLSVPYAFHAKSAETVTGEITETDPVFSTWDKDYEDLTNKPDLSNFIEAESDPTVPAHVKGITTGNVANWNTAYSWGDHDLAGYLTTAPTETDPTVPAHVKSITTGNVANWNTAYSWGDHSTEGYLTNFTEADPTVPAHVKSITTGNVANWNTAYSWGNHDLAGYLTSYNETDPTVPAHVKSITTGNVANWNTAYSWGNHADGGYAPSTHAHTLTEVLSTNNSAGNNRITNLQNPGAPQDAATKDYVDGLTATGTNEYVISPLGAFTGNELLVLSVGSNAFLHCRTTNASMLRYLFIPLPLPSMINGVQQKIQSVTITYMVHTGGRIDQTHIHGTRPGNSVNSVMISNTTNRTSTTWEDYTVTTATPLDIEGTQVLRLGLIFAGTDPSLNLIYIKNVKITLTE